MSPQAKPLSQQVLSQIQTAIDLHKNHGFSFTAAANKARIGVHILTKYCIANKITVRRERVKNKNTRKSIRLPYECYDSIYL